MTFKPLVQFKSITIAKAFIANALVLGVVAGLSIELRRSLDVHKGTKQLSRIEKLALTIVGTFFIAAATFVTARLLFGFGSGMLAKSHRRSTRFW